MSQISYSMIWILNAMAKNALWPIIEHSLLIFQQYYN